MVKPIPRFHGYFVDEHGDVWSDCPLGNNRPSPGLRKKKATVNPTTGYRTVTLSDGYKTFTMHVSPLVAEAFLGPRPKGMLCLHGSAGRLDDSASNLSWGSRSKNNGEDRVRDGTIPRGEKNWRHKVTLPDVEKIIASRGKVTAVKLSARYGISAPAVCQIWSGRSWKWVKR
jgi:hypothetical protein